MIRRNVRFLTLLFVSAILCHVFGQEPTPSDAKPTREEAFRAAEEVKGGNAAPVTLLDQARNMEQAR